MKPFDLAAAKAGQPLVTRDGREVVEFHHWESVSQGDNTVINAVVKGHAGYNSRHGYTINGHYLSDDREHSLDLFMATTVVTRWFNIYEDIGYHCGGTLHESYAAAAESGSVCSNYICTSCVTFEV